MGLGDIVQKAVYLGIGVASYAGEKAGERLGEVRDQMQKLADEMVARGEMSAEEGRKFVDDMVKKAQQPAAKVPTEPAPAPRPIEITDEPAASQTASPPVETQTPPAQAPATASDDIDIENMRRQVQELQDELRRLRKN
jgi:polyhydroxyalkanoate synthesis regulator phasin